MATPIPHKTSLGVPLTYNVGDFQVLPKDLIIYIFSFLERSTVMPRIGRYFKICHESSLTNIPLLKGKPDELVCKHPSDKDPQDYSYQFVAMDRSLQGTIALVSRVAIIIVKDEAMSRFEWNTSFRNHETFVKFQNERTYITTTFGNFALDTTDKAEFAHPSPNNTTYSKYNSTELRAFTPNIGRHPIQVLDEQLKIVKTIPAGEYENCSCLCVTSDAVFAAYSQGFIARYNDLGIYQITSIAFENSDAFISNLLVHNNYLIAIGHGDCESNPNIFVYDSKTLRLIGNELLPDEINNVKTIHFINDLYYLVMTNGKIVAYEINADKVVQKHLFRVKSSPLHDISFHENRIAIAAKNRVEFWSLEGKIEGVIKTQSDPIAIQYNGTEAVVSFVDGTVKRWAPPESKPEILQEEKFLPKETIKSPQPELKKEIPKKKSTFFLFRPLTWFWSFLKSCFN